MDKVSVAKQSPILFINPHPFWPFSLNSIKDNLKKGLLRVTGLHNFPFSDIGTDRIDIRP